MKKGLKKSREAAIDLQKKPSSEDIKRKLFPGDNEENNGFWHFSIILQKPDFSITQKSNHSENSSDRDVICGYRDKSTTYSGDKEIDLDDVSYSDAKNDLSEPNPSKDAKHNLNNGLPMKTAEEPTINPNRKLPSQNH